MDAKRVVLEQTFISAYSIDNFTKFIKEFFNNCNILNKEYNDSWNWSEFNYYIKRYTHVANYIDPNKSKIAIFAVELKKNRSVERARSMQRNFISKLISNANYDAAIVAFYTADELKWRLSLVRLDYEFAKGRVKAKLTPAKRYSYLVGEKEPCHTAMERLLPIFQNDKFNPTLDNIEEAFNVEKVTEDFFKKYKEKYHELKEHLDNSEDFNEEAERHNFTSEQFAKKLMGQLAFLYFLQKKGWLGVKVVPHTINEKQYKNAYYNYNKAARTIVPKVYQQIFQDKYALNYEILKGLNDEEANVLAGCFNPEPWGSGTKSFIRDLFNNCLKLQEKEKKNFFDDYLEPLFYEALNHRRGYKNYYNKFNCKIPFLNGGLFEPLESYDWKNSKFEIPNDLFSNEHIKGKENADGILDVFDRYNFTMNEDEPLEREVAVDPEMLGKIFENLLDVKDRKSKGAFYTPREIVHYMCQESLINYLVNETGILYKDIKEFITYGEIMKDEDTSKVGKVGIEEIQIPMAVYKNLKVIDDKLADVKVADPAVGSGAFPMGMISEIVKARNNITAYMASQFLVNSNMTEAEKKMQYTQRAIVYDNRNPYILKWETIKNSIYAVDIEASAVDITKLRLWLSLVVDEDLEPTFEEKTYGENKQKDPHPLPNLDCNIMCGNSLIDEFEGIKLFDDNILNKNEHSSGVEETSWQLSLFKDNIEKLLQELFKQQDNLFGEDDIERKTIIKKKIDKTIDEIIRVKLSRDGNADGLKKYEESIKQKTKPYFLWKLEFAKVFKEKGGFDVVVGNPPYVKVQNLSHEIIDTLKERWKTAWKRIDISTLFIELGYSIINSIGSVNYISSNQFLTTEYGRKMREFLLENYAIRKMLDFGDLPIFENAMTYVGIFFLDKNQNGEFRYNRIRKLPFIAPQNFENIDTKSLSGEAWSLGSSELSKTMAKIENATSDKLSSFAKAWYGVITGKDNLLMFDIEDDPKIEDEMLLPVIRAQGCDRYCFASPSKKVVYPYFLNNEDTLIYTLEELKENYQDTYNYIMDNQKELKERKDSRNTFGQRAGWYGLVRFGQISTFSKSKIVTPGEVKHNKFGLDLTKSGFTGARVFSITVEDEKLDIKYLLALLNSKVIEFYLHHIASLKQGGYYSYSTTVLERIPIIISNNQTGYVELVNEIMCKKTRGEDTTVLEEQIDELVYELYNLDEKDIDIIIKDLGGC